MNENAAYNRTKVALVLAFNLLGSMLLSQPTALVGQTPTRITRPTPTATGSPAPIKPADKQSKPIVKKNLPGLEITEVKADFARCDFWIRVVNRGGGNAGPFIVYANYKTSLQYVVVQAITTLDIMKAAEVKGLAAGDSVLVLIRPAFFNLSGNACAAKDVGIVHAVADPRYLYQDGPSNNQNIKGLINPRSHFPIPAGVKVAESRIDESNENNNELTVNKSQFKPYP